MSTTSDLHYGRYAIRTRQIGATIKARAFVGSKGVADAEGATVAEAVQVLTAKLDTRNNEQRVQRVNGIPTADEFVDAFTRLDAKVGPHHWKMLAALYAAPGQTLTATQLAAAAGYTSHASANEKFGVLARMVADDLGYEPAQRGDGSTIWTDTLATDGGPSDSDEHDHWHWKMRPEVAECLRRLNGVECR